MIKKLANDTVLSCIGEEVNLQVKLHEYTTKVMGALLFDTDQDLSEFSGDVQGFIPALGRVSHKPNFSTVSEREKCKKVLEWIKQLFPRNQGFIQALKEEELYSKDWEIDLNIAALFGAGVDNPSFLITYYMVYQSLHPNTFKSATIEEKINEIGRVCMPAYGVLRTRNSEMVIVAHNETRKENCEQKIAPFQQISLAFSSVGASVPEPEKLDPKRTCPTLFPKDYFLFGSRLQRCLGIYLTKILFEEFENAIKAHNISIKFEGEDIPEIIGAGLSTFITAPLFTFTQ